MEWSEVYLSDNQAIHIIDLENHLLCPMQCHQNGVHINEVPKFLAEIPGVTIHAIQLIYPFNTAHLLIILLQLSSVKSYFDVYSPSMAEYEIEDIHQIHFTAEEPSWDLSTIKYLEKRLVC